jgi:carotenoid cleavage dioxygenase
VRLVPLRRRRRRLLRFEPVEAHGHPFLSANFAPVPEERVITGPFPVTGTLPDELDGMVVRNGPNPATIGHAALYRWCTGDGMVHALTLRRGKATRYTNRFVRTRSLAAQVDVPPPRGPSQVADSPANAGVIAHGGKLLALAEGGLPHRLNRRLDTVGTEDFDGMLASPVSPLPRLDPAGGSLTMIGYDSFGPPYLFVYEVDADGRVTHATEVDTPRPVMHHDFGLTASRVVLLDLPVVHDADRLRYGTGTPFSFFPEVGARLGLLDRGAAGATTRWVEVEAAAVFHVVNAHDHGEAVVLDVCRHDQAFASDEPPDGARGPGVGASPVLERLEIDPVAATVASSTLEAAGWEWPAVDPRHLGRPYRFAYFAEPATAWAEKDTGALYRYDLVHHETAVYDPGPGRVAGQPLFVGGAGAHRLEGDGWVLSFVYDASEERSDLVVLDASSFSGPPQAVVHLPVRVPHGLHGSFVPAGAL